MKFDYSVVWVVWRGFGAEANWHISGELESDVGDEVDEGV